MSENEKAPACACDCHPQGCPNDRGLSARALVAEAEVGRRFQPEYVHAVEARVAALMRIIEEAPRCSPLDPQYHDSTEYAPAPLPPAEGETGKVLTREEYVDLLNDRTWEAAEREPANKILCDMEKRLLAHDAALRERVETLVANSDEQRARADALQEEVDRLKKELGR